jgi:nucleoside-diphosphate-sugar epimerase
MRIVVIGATGNVGTSVLARLAADPEVEEIVAVARRAAELPHPRTTLVTADIARDELRPIVSGADVVIHLAWLIQPGRDESVTRAVNVDGTRRLIDAVVEAGVPSFVYASSVGAYAPGPKDRLVDESWPTTGIATSFYSRHKVATERMLDELEAEHPRLRVVRLRPGLIFKASAATEIRRLFVGPFVPRALINRALVPVVPRVARLRFQAVHSDDVGEAYRLAARSDVRGAFNIVADPVIGAAELAEVLGARQLPLAPAVLRGAAAASYALRLQPTEPGWVDMALGTPLLDPGRAHRELGWAPARTGTEALAELIDAMHRGEDDTTPPLAAATSGPMRVRELLTGVGRRV